MKRVLVGACWALALDASASAPTKTVMAPPYPLRRTASLLEPELHTGRTALTLEGSSASGAGGGSGFGLSGAFPLPGLGTDWVVGAAAGLSNSVLLPGRFVSPSQYYWELSLARTQVTAFDEADTGLHGYLEFLIRDQRPQPTAELDAQLTLLNTGIRDHNLSLGARLGAANDQLGTGLVQQAPPVYAFSLQSGIFLPLSEQGLVLTLRSEVTRVVWHPWVRVGLSGSFLAWTKTLTNPNQGNELHPLAENFSRRYGLGAVADFRLARRYLVRLSSDFSWITSPSGTLACRPGILASTSLSY